MDNAQYGKANRRIRKWAECEGQINHKIISAYFTCLEHEGFATVESMRKLCSDRSNTALYVEKFAGNYANMKTDAGHSHGRVFEDDGHRVWIWDVVEPTLLKYRKEFMGKKDV